ncbi:Holliday junction branch migration protein RuvA [Sporosarcina sp. P3]|uniref:Holliday junction branch migration complex subunit RuvA n=1 Tax=Sporosarcina ureae TaxID=1571 RepID=A0ABM6JSB4_SPOUR|nr:MULTISPECIES: Holliday junction branch migration protein RuvA [Sporosarcina]ARF13066.1 Holliday junction DNA helicase RuvA [Sporosarcina ureae]ARF16195.1 Holliday junction DNA helicase RuvA [Sporosarcina ureae]PIC57905.1 Holliday junction branch migration protein RuvA [Sporosarcina sp. P10]PIC61287.1 Holliday junction branch migration protein RuvA [Sporosarcina sp. P12(2017)]PIC75905.1 Holliday junction branch migration protein RuvA [Sporosarcina sp. P19]
MYDYIKGYVTRVTPEYVVLEQSGIGWQVMTPNPFAFHVTEEVQQVFTYLHVREDTQLLIGFKTLEQRELFRKLITVSGIGPKGALAILANGLPSQVVSAIEREDEGFLVQFPGVGKKTARQMILDLKGKLHDLFTEIDLPDSEDTLLTLAESDELDEAMLALTALGYSDRELKKVKPKLEKEELDTEGYMRLALKLLLKQG